MIYAGIVAGGTGTRMGSDIPKQFLPLGDKPIIIHTIAAFLHSNEIDNVIVAVHSDWLEHSKKLAAEFFPNDERLTIISGGSDRNATVFKIIDEIHRTSAIGNEDIILTHDAVRPFVNDKMIHDNIVCAKRFPACTTAVSAVDTILYSENGKTIDNVPARSKLYHAQTPQTFNIKALQAAYQMLSDEQISALTDTCSIFSANGLAVQLVEGDVRNIKITNPNDMIIANAILQSL